MVIKIHYKYLLYLNGTQKSLMTPSVLFALERLFCFPIFSGCCKPPTVCGYGYVNPILWMNPTNPTADPDCYVWNNDPSQLCYGCNSCKAGLLGNLRMEWRKVNVVLIISVVILIFIYVIGCCAFKNAQTEDLFDRYKQGWV
ncbi:hypothetical protein MKW94_011501 [Papaver nudicaule]|uniref:Tetraspanin/Peripherin n=1 Tax=Papaver nudicaule TaxID=74823 RepID=A0AA41S3J4_PAPNU|nr:hypothetical protein [Papaver nudicaule]